MIQCNLLSSSAKINRYGTKARDDTVEQDDVQYNGWLAYCLEIRLHTLTLLWWFHDSHFGKSYTWIF